MISIISFVLRVRRQFLPRCHLGGGEAPLLSTKRTCRRLLTGLGTRPFYNAVHVECVSAHTQHQRAFVTGQLAVHATTLEWRPTYAAIVAVALVPAPFAGHLMESDLFIAFSRLKIHLTPLLTDIFKIV